MSKKRAEAAKPSQTGSGPADNPGLAVRALAARAFTRVLSERRSIEEALQSSLKTPLSEADFLLARAILTVAFRHLGTIRQALRDRLTTGNLPEAGNVHAALTISLAQILFMDTADHAAVDLGVELCKADPKARHLVPLVNALLRRVCREKAAVLAHRSEQGPQADLPAWLCERWARAHGAQASEAIASVLATPPHVDLTPIANHVALDEAIGGRRLPTGSIRLQSETPITDLPGYTEGWFQVQDAAAAIPARLIGGGAGTRLLDLCAAPGGKTAQLAKTGAEVVAVERNASRAERLRGNLTRLNLAATIAIADAVTFSDAPFDAVLLDAPCSATGTIRRHPEIAWTKTLADILALAAQQSRLLENAARLLKIGGTLVFATCSLEPEEGERQIDAFLKAHPGFAPAPINIAALGLPEASLAAPGCLRILPQHLAEFGGCDGFFAARLHRHA